MPKYLSQIIEFFMKMLSEKRQDSVATLDTFFWPTFTSNGYNKAVHTMLNKLDLFTKDFLLLPLHVNGNHWSLIVSRILSYKIEFYLHGFQYFK